MDTVTGNTRSLLDSLNEEQRLAVKASLNGSILVLAGAGCGKTTVLTRRIGWLCSKGISPSRICALTFTRKAAEEMRARIEKLSQSHAIISMLQIATFHSISLTILRDTVDKTDNFSKLGYPVHPRLQSDKDRLRLIYGITSAEERDILGDLVVLDGLLSKRVIFPERLNGLGDEKVAILKTVADRISLKKKEEGFWGFDDLTPAVITLFNRYPLVHQFYMDKYDYILVDEFQDTNPVQIEFLKMLLTSHTGLFVVGDDDQAIYGFRGADVRPTMEFRSVFADAQIIKLQTNYRSVNSILATANKIFKSKPIAYRKVLRSGLKNNPAGVKPIAITFESQEEMVGWVLREAESISTKLSVSITDCAMLFRINRSREWVDDYFKRSGIQQCNLPCLFTIHASKGLEFPAVFLCDLEDSVFPNYRQSRKIKPVNVFQRLLAQVIPPKKNIECDWDEEQRLFYVGITRAQKALYFISVKCKMISGKKKTCTKSRFLRLIDR